MSYRVEYVKLLSGVSHIPHVYFLNLPLDVHNQLLFKVNKLR